MESARTDFEACLRKSDGGVLQPWVEESAARWGVDDLLLADFCDGLLVVPFLTLSAKRGLLRDLAKTDFASLAPAVRREIVALLAKRGWIEGAAGRYRTTPPGQFMFDRALNLGVAASYRPMLLKLPTLLFGAASTVFKKDSAGHETHIDRSMNVMGSGFQHDRYFADVDQLLISIFSAEPLESQPRYVADMGCGDGTFLKRVYETVQEQNAAGRAARNSSVDIGCGRYQPGLA